MLELTFYKRLELLDVAFKHTTQNESLYIFCIFYYTSSFSTKFTAKLNPKYNFLMRFLIISLKALKSKPFRVFTITSKTSKFFCKFMSGGGRWLCSCLIGFINSIISRFTAFFVILNLGLYTIRRWIITWSNIRGI